MEKTCADITIHFKSHNKTLTIKYRHMAPIIKAMADKIPYVALKNEDEDVYLIISIDDISFIQPYLEFLDE